MAQLQTLEFKQAFEEFDKVPLVHTYVQPSSSFSKRYFTDIEIHLWLCGFGHSLLYNVFLHCNNKDTTLASKAVEEQLQHPLQLQVGKKMIEN